MQAKFQETYDKWADLNRQLYRDSKEYIMNVLLNAPNGEVVISETASVSVSYDGGNHPEYNSNCFSAVERVYLKEDEIYLEIEDAVDYSIENINASELYCVADAVECSIEYDDDDFIDEDEEDTDED